MEWLDELFEDKDVVVITYARVKNEKRGEPELFNWLLRMLGKEGKTTTRDHMRRIAKGSEVVFKIKTGRR